MSSWGSRRTRAPVITLASITTCGGRVHNVMLREIGRLFKEVLYMSSDR